MRPQLNPGAHNGTLIFVLAAAHPHWNFDAMRAVQFLSNVCPCSWDLSQPPRDNSPAMRLNRHSQQVTGLAQITDERLVSSSMDGTVSPTHTRFTLNFRVEPKAVESKAEEENAHLRAL